MLVGLDAGHGGTDPGGNDGPYVEKDMNLTVVRLIEERLANTKVRTFLTRTNDSFVGLEERGHRANKAQVNLFVSVHFNAANRRAKGYEVYHYPKSVGGIKMANLLAEEFGKTQVKRYVGDKMMAGGEKGSYTVLVVTHMPAVLGEYLFLDTPEDVAKYDPDIIADAYANAILRYFDQPTLKPAKIHDDRLDKIGLYLEKALEQLAEIKKGH